MSPAEIPDVVEIVVLMLGAIGLLVWFLSR